MKIAVLQHVGFEDAGVIGELLQQAGHELLTCRLYRHDSLPVPELIDAVVVMGGPMGVADEVQFPWLIDEKVFISAAIRAGKPVLGICLGAQLIAEVLGAAVYRAAQREIGWFPVNTTPVFLQSPFGEILGESFIAFHWHGDTFTLPQDAVPVGSSAACACQGFIFAERVVALQFHLEMTSAGVEKLARHCANELTATGFVQSADQLLAHNAYFAEMHQRMAQLLHVWLQQ